MRKALFLAGVFCVFFSCQTPVFADSSITAGRVQAEYQKEAGLYIYYDGVPVIKGNHFDVLADDHFTSFSSAFVDPAVERRDLAEGGRALVLLYRDPAESFQAAQTVEIYRNNSVVIEFQAEWYRDGAAVLDWIPARLWAPAIDSGALKFTFSQEDAAGDIILFRGDKSFYDWAMGKKIIWLRASSIPLDKKTVHRRVRLSFADGNVSPQADVLTVKSKSLPFSKMENVREAPTIIPQPKRVSFERTGYRITSQTEAYLESEDPRLERAFRRFLEETSQNPPLRKTGPEKKRGIVVRVGARFDFPDAAPEAYRLNVNRRGAEIVSRDPAGAFYGIQTLRQLMRRDEKGVSLRGVKITDWPSLRFRGAHMFVDRDALPFHKKLIERILSRYKLNHLILECQRTRWVSHPEIAVDSAMSKTDLAEDVRFAREHFLEPVPLIAGPGHAGWMFANGRNLHLAEDPEKPNSFCPNLEGSYDLLFDIYAEVIEVFNPGFFHVGHDEVNILSRGRFPRHAECLAEGGNPELAVTELLTKSAAKAVTYLRQRRVEPLVWGDMFLHRTEIPDYAGHALTKSAAEKARIKLKEFFPGGIVTDWHYAPLPKEAYPSLKIFKDAGFRVVATPWYRPENIYQFSQAAIKYEALGLLQPTWTDEKSHEGLLQTDFRQFAALILAAEYAWSGNPLPPERLPYHPGAVFKKEWDAGKSLPPVRAAWYLDFSAGMNSRPPDLSALPVGQVAFHGVPFHIEGDRGGAKALMLAGKLNAPSPSPYPKEAVLDVNETASDILLLHATAYDSLRSVGRYVFMYSDGTVSEFPLRSGEETRALTDPGEVWGGELAWQGVDRLGQPVAVYMAHWKNPQPDKIVRTIYFKSEDPAASPLLLAVTGIKSLVEQSKENALLQAA